MRYGVGIDISKGKSTVAIIDEERNIIEKPFEIEHCQEQMKDLEEKIKKLGTKEVKIVMEVTGNYYLPVYTYLKEKKYYVVAENALKIKRYTDMDLRRKKTDKKDSLKIAEYCIDNWNKLKESEMKSEKYLMLNLLSRRYFAHTSIKVKAKVDFSNLCDMLFPGYYQLLTDDNREIGLEILEKYNTPEDIKKAGEETFLEEVDEIVKESRHKRAGLNLAAKILSLSKTAISPIVSNDYTRQMVKDCADVLVVSERTTNDIIAQMEKIATELPEYEEIKKVSGIGDKTALCLIGEIGDITRFKNAGSLIAYAGIDSPPYQSGNINIEGCHISKRGNKYLRRTLYQISLCAMAIKKDECVIGNFVNKKLSEGKLSKVSMVAGGTKTLRMYYGIVKKIYKEEIINSK